MLWILLFSSYAFPSVFFLCLSLLNSGCGGFFFFFLMSSLIVIGVTYIKLSAQWLHLKPESFWVFFSPSAPVKSLEHSNFVRDRVGIYGAGIL